jgi:hypothetical protein
MDGVALALPPAGATGVAIGKIRQRSGSSGWRRCSQSGVSAVANPSSPPRTTSENHCVLLPMSVKASSSERVEWNGHVPLVLVIRAHARRERGHDHDIA